MRQASRVVAGCASLFATIVFSASAHGAPTPAEIADKAIVKMRAIEQSALKHLSKLESKGVVPLRKLARQAESIDDRRSQVVRRSAKAGPIAEEACVKLLKERDRALGRLVALESTAPPADLTAARTRLRETRDMLLGSIGGRADDVTENMARAAVLDPGDRAELEMLTVDAVSPSCDVQEENL